MKQMKIKKPNDVSNNIEMWSNHVVSVDDLTGEMEIEEFEIKFQGQLSDWLEEYLINPLGSRLHKNLVRVFRDWFEDNS